MSTAVSAPWATWSALPSAVLALSLSGGHARAGISPVPSETPRLELKLSRMATSVTATEAKRDQKFESSAAVQTPTDLAPKPVTFEVFEPASEVAGQRWPGGFADSSAPLSRSNRPARSRSQQSADVSEPGASGGTAIPLPPAIQSGMVGIAGLGVIAILRRARRALL